MRRNAVEWRYRSIGVGVQSLHSTMAGQKARPRNYDSGWHIVARFIRAQ